ncbi:MAG: hypothetical protein KAH30_02480 [Caldisericia bacterium]|nr:hypothetical protein [Caldisericia bacterium]
MKIRIIELCSYGDIADFEAIDFDSVGLDLSYKPDGWESKGGNSEAKKFVKDDFILEVYIEGRLIILNIPSNNGETIAKQLLESWPSLDSKN